MHIRHAFTAFLEAESEAAPNAAIASGLTLDWRWFCEPAPRVGLPSERSLIDWPTWARPKTPRRDWSAPH